MDQLLEKVFKSTEKALYKLIPAQLKAVGYQTQDITTNKGNYIYAKGDLPVLLVAHLDTVFKHTPKEIIQDQGILYNPSCGLGADDRAGVYSILQIANITANNNMYPHILFTSGEEIGGLGAITASRELYPDVKFIIELDRQGKNDCVFYNCDNELFIQYVESFGYTFNYGSFSDISILCPAWGMAGVNLSIGYYNQHTKNEYLVISEIQDTITKVVDMLANIPDEPFGYIPGNSKKKKKLKKNNKKPKKYLYSDYEVYDQLDDEEKLYYYYLMGKDEL